MTHGVHHVGLTVHDPSVAAAFFVERLGFRVSGGRGTAVFVTDGTTLLTLWEASVDTAFDRAHPGLHHLALRVRDRAALDWPDAEFGPEPMGTSGNWHTMFAGPSGLRLELVWVPE